MNTEDKETAAQPDLIRIMDAVRREGSVKTNSEILSALATHHQPVANDARDAARYRYVRATTTAIRNTETGEREECTPDLFDAAIDRGMLRAAIHSDGAPQPATFGKAGFFAHLGKCFETVKGWPNWKKPAKDGYIVDTIGMETGQFWGNKVVEPTSPWDGAPSFDKTIAEARQQTEMWKRLAEMSSQVLEESLRVDRLLADVGATTAAVVKLPSLTDEQILEAMKPHLLAADGGYVFDTAKDHCIAAGRAAVAQTLKLQEK